MRCSSPAPRRCACACEWRAHLYIINRSPTAGPRCRPKIQFRPHHRRRRRRGAARRGIGRRLQKPLGRPRPTGRRRRRSGRAQSLSVPATSPFLWDRIRFVVNPPFSSVRIRSSVLAICGGDSAGVLYQTSLLYCIIIIL